MQLSNSQRLLLEAILTHDGEWNWYKLGRACLSELDTPAEFSLKSLLDAGYIREFKVDDEPLPRLQITDSGKRILECDKE